LRLAQDWGLPCVTKTAPPAAGVSRANGVAAPPALPPYACCTSHRTRRGEITNQAVDHQILWQRASRAPASSDWRWSDVVPDGLGVPSWAGRWSVQRSSIGRR